MNNFFLANESSTSTDSAYDQSDASELSNGRQKKQTARALRRTMSVSYSPLILCSKKFIM